MPHFREVKGFAGRYLLVNLAYLIPMGLCFWVAWRSFSTSGLAFALALSGFLACFVLGVWLDVLSLRRFRCPECHSPLPWQPRKPGERIRFFCVKCDIVWDTGLNEADD